MWANGCRLGDKEGKKKRLISWGNTQEERMEGEKTKIATKAKQFQTRRNRVVKGAGSTKEKK